MSRVFPGEENISIQKVASQGLHFPWRLSPSPLDIAPWNMVGILRMLSECSRWVTLWRGPWSQRAFTAHTREWAKGWKQGPRSNRVKNSRWCLKRRVFKEKAWDEWGIQREGSRGFPTLLFILSEILTKISYTFACSVDSESYLYLFHRRKKEF